MASPINKKKPEECTDISEIRLEIDNIDKEIIRLLSDRFKYVKEVVKYKDGTPEGIEAADRKVEVIRSRGQWAAECGLNSEVVEEIYERLVQYFIDEEKRFNEKLK